MKKSVLGRGLSALIPGGGEDIDATQITEIPIEEICLNPMQPRKRIVDEKIDELSNSIRELGVIQPVIVTKKDGLYHLVVGERRLRASKKLGLEKIPAIIKETSWEEMLQIAIVENIQREDLNPVEEARAYKLLMSEFNHTQEEMAVKMGKSRPYIANIVRLLNLPPDVLMFLESGELSAGHGRALLGLSDEKQIIEIAARIIEEKLSVRETEELVNRLKEEKPQKESRKPADHQFQRLENHLCEKFATRVKIKTGRDNKGKIEVHYASVEEFNRIIEIFGAQENWDS
ncbi:MAG: ParB/RepB/Spo0J family partition protein [Firmicutes bacterium]|nr:ParB/RepB/Spo0J family partition protein [Bacillota bacterium]